MKSPDEAHDARGMEMFERTHSSLIRAAEGGNLTAAKWEAFGMRYRPVLVRYAKQILRLPHESAEDAVQNLLVKMWLSPHLIRRPPNGKFRYVLGTVKIIYLRLRVRQHKRISYTKRLCAHPCITCGDTSQHTK